MVVCAVRSGEARRAVWEEIDLDNPVWTIPAAGIRANCGHRVPLSDRALEVLRETAAIQRGELVFPVPATGRALSVAALGDVVRTARIDAVPHGFRSSFRDWAAARTRRCRSVQNRPTSLHSRGLRPKSKLSTETGQVHSSSSEPSRASLSIAAETSVAPGTARSDP